MIILAIVLLAAGALTIFVPIMLYDMEQIAGENDYEELREQFSRDSAGNTLQREPRARIYWFGETEHMDGEAPGVSETAYSVETEPISPAASVAASQENRDFIAWIRLPGTSVDYPVVQSDHIDYYLNHTFTGKKSSLGTLFSLTKTDYQTPGANIAIYGHHIRSNENVMFSPLMQYKQQSFYAGHETIHLDSLYHADTYTVFAVLNMRYGDWDPSTASFSSEQDFLDFVDRAKSQSLYDTGVEVKASDKILTLITCDRGFIPVYGRLVVMAVKQ